MASTPGSWTSVGKKIVVALTGMGLMLFLLGHVSGNLILVFGSDEAFNDYGHKLVSNPFIYLVEAGLVLIFLFHFTLALLHVARGRDARPTGYVSQTWAGGKSRKSLSSTLMLLSGLTILIFVIFHVASMKYGAFIGTFETPEGIHDLATQTRTVFSSPVTVLVYEVVMVLVGMHLWHGFSSAFQSLGISHPRLEGVLRPLGWVFAIVVGGGFLLIPLVVFLNLI